MKTNRKTVQLAMDRSAREIDMDGHLHVAAGSVISRACVSDYQAEEVPGWQELGLQPGQIVRLYRDPAEMARGAESLHGKPLLMHHKPVTAEDHPAELVVGSVANPEFRDGILTAELVIWSQPAIDGISDSSHRSLSAGYRYLPVMKPGTTPDGSRFDGRMTAIVYNHVTLCDAPRVDGAMVADSAADADFDKSKHPRGGNQENPGQFSEGSGGGKTVSSSKPGAEKVPSKRSALSRATENAIQDIFAESGVDTWDKLRTLAAEGRTDAAEWKKASRRCDRLEMEAINKAYGKEYQGKLDSKTIEPFYSDEFWALQSRMEEISEKYDLWDGDELAYFAKTAPNLLAKAEKLRVRLLRGKGADSADGGWKLVADALKTFQEEKKKMPNNGLRAFASKFKQMAADVGPEVDVAKILEAINRLPPETQKAVKAALAKQDEPAEGEGTERFDEFEEDEAPNEVSFKKSRNLSMPELGKSAMDSGFFSRYPHAARVTAGGDLWACKPDHKPRPQQTIAQDNSFFSRFPLARRLG